jgi:hypothetical protein
LPVLDSDEAQAQFSAERLLDVRGPELCPNESLAPGKGRRRQGQGLCPRQLRQLALHLPCGRATREILLHPRRHTHPTIREDWEQRHALERNHIGHDSVIDDHCFITSHVVVSGNVHVKSYCFIGVNATLRNSIVIAEQTLIGAGAGDHEEHEAEGRLPTGTRGTVFQDSELTLSSEGAAAGANWEWSSRYHHGRVLGGHARGSAVHRCKP